MRTYVAQKPKLVMTLTDKEGKRQAHIINPWDRAGYRFLTRTLQYAAHNKLEVTFRPTNGN